MLLVPLFSIWYRIEQMAELISIGLILGLSAGFSPGPLLALVISETLQQGVRSGIKVALSPLITDLPIIVLTLFVLKQLSGLNNLLGVISLIGGCVVLFMGYKSMNPKMGESGISERVPRPLLKGVLVNALSPHPYLFWLSVGGPIINKAMGIGTMAPFVFLGSFYMLLVGSKVVLALLAGQSRIFFKGTAYRYTMRLLGFALVVLGVMLFRDGLMLLEVIDLSNGR